MVPARVKKGRDMKKKVLSFTCSLMMICMILLANGNVAHAADDRICVDGSYLTMEESSTGTIIKSRSVDAYLKNGQSTVSSAGVGKVYAYGDTEAYTTVDYVAVVVYVEYYDWDVGKWRQIDSWSASKRNAYFVSTAKTVYVDSGLYCRVRCEHFAGDDDDLPYDSDGSHTDGIWVK